jgi:hypothetical protein
MTQQFRRTSNYLGILGLAAGMTQWACTKVDAVPYGNTEPGTVVSCGSLSAEQAAELVTSRLDHFGSVGLTALSAIENSRAVARLLSFGESSIIEPFLEEGLSELREGLANLHDEQLVPTNVETEQGKEVTFLLSPEAMCKDTAPTATPVVTPTGGTSNQGTSSTPDTSTNVDPECVKDKTEHPVRLRISRIDCDKGDNVAIELLRGNELERIAVAKLYANNAELELDVGAYLRAAETRSYSSSEQSDGTTIEKSTVQPMVSEAVGTVRGSLQLDGSARAEGKLSVTQGIDFTTTGEKSTRVRIAAGTDVASIIADGIAKRVELAVNLGAIDWQSKFEYFISQFFGLSVTPAAATEAPVDVRVAGLRGQLVFDGSIDTIDAKGLSIGDGASATQSGQTLLSVKALDAKRQAIDTRLLGTASDGIQLDFPAGLSVEIGYALEPKMSLLEYPANYLAKDTLGINVPPASSLLLYPQTPEYDDEPNLAVTSDQTGTLLGVSSGSLTFTSALWPSETTVVPTNQCLVRIDQNLGDGRHDLMDDFLISDCSKR